MFTIMLQDRKGDVREVASPAITKKRLALFEARGFTVLSWTKNPERAYEIVVNDLKRVVNTECSEADLESTVRLFKEVHRKVNLG